MNNDLNFLQTASPLSKKFFSKENKEILQVNMKNLVYKKIGVKIGRQSDDELTTVMRSIFFQNSRNKADKINEQVEEANARKRQNTTKIKVQEKIDELTAKYELERPSE